MNITRNEKTVTIGSAIGIVIIAFVVIQANIVYPSCLSWYDDLGHRLNALHEKFDIIVQRDPDGVSPAGQELVNDYKTIHQETARFNTECSISGFNIPKFSN